MRSLIRSLVTSADAIPEGKASKGASAYLFPIGFQHIRNTWRKPSCRCYQRDTNAGATKLHLLLHASAETAVPQPIFRPKRQFTLESRQGLLVKLQIGGMPMNLSRSDAQDPTDNVGSLQQPEDKTVVANPRAPGWYQCTSSIRGLTVRTI